MIGNRRVLGVIPARGGSKGVPGKNLRTVGGRPLIAWSILAGQASNYIDRLIVSTDDDAIAEVARAYGCDAPFRRPKHLSSDSAGSVDVALHASDFCGWFDYLVLLQPTSPLRTASDIDGALECCYSRSAPACISVKSVDEHPYWMYAIDKNDCLEKFSPVALPSRRQDLPEIFIPNGAVYVIEPQALRSTLSFLPDGTVAFRMPVERSVDIDSELDIRIADSLLV